MKTIEKKVMVPKLVKGNYAERADLFKFLREHNALAGFYAGMVRNIVLREDAIPDLNCEIEKLFSKSRPEEVISYCFAWITTREGHEYWSKLSDKWEYWCTANEIKGWAD